MAQKIKSPTVAPPEVLPIPTPEQIRDLRWAMGRDATGEEMPLPFTTFGQYFGCNYHTVSDWENGKRTMFASSAIIFWRLKEEFEKKVGKGEGSA